MFAPNEVLFWKFWRMVFSLFIASNVIIIEGFLNKGSENDKN